MQHPWGGNGGISIRNRLAQLQILEWFSHNVEVEVGARARRELGEVPAGLAIASGEDGFSAKYMAIAGYRVAAPDEAARFSLDVTNNRLLRHTFRPEAPFAMHVHDGGQWTAQLHRICRAIP